MTKFFVATCALPLPPANGELLHISGGEINGIYFEGTEAHFQCDSDYKIVGNPSICQVDGNWTNYTCSGNSDRFT